MAGVRLQPPPPTNCPSVRELELILPSLTPSPLIFLTSLPQGDRLSGTNQPTPHPPTHTPSSPSGQVSRHRGFSAGGRGDICTLNRVGFVPPPAALPPICLTVAPRAFCCILGCSRCHFSHNRPSKCAKATTSCCVHILAAALLRFCCGSALSAHAGHVHRIDSWTA